MESYLIKGIFIGLLFGLPVGAVGTMTVQRTFHYGIKAGLMTGLGSSAADCFYACIGAFSLLFSLTACSNDQKDRQRPDFEADTDVAEPESVAWQDNNADMQMEENADERTEDNLSGEYKEMEQEASEYRMNIEVDGHLLTATLVQNSSAEALLKMLSDGPVTIDMSDYANMEKVGALPESLPRNDGQISTEAGDLILYQGNAFVIYYDTNSWNFTRLGKINNITQQELKDILGEGDVKAVLSLPSE